MNKWQPTPACEGGDTIPIKSGMEDMEQCPVCGDAVRWDMVDHPFFGFSAMGCGKSKQHSENKSCG
jgi:hypothetical protein